MVVFMSMIMMVVVVIVVMVATMIGRFKLLLLFS